MKSLFNVFMAAVVIIFAGCQKQDLNEPGKNETGKATLTASIGDMTKIGFEDQDAAGLKVTWSAGDKIGLYDVSGNFACVFVLSTGEEGKTKANFTLESGNFDPTKPYTVVYPYIENKATLNDYKAEKTIRLAADQTQDGATLDHLAGLCFMEGANTASSIAFTHTISILTLKLEKPTDADQAEVLTSIGFTNGSKSYNLNITNGAWANSAYMIIDPIVEPNRNLSFDVATNAGNFFNYSVATSKPYEAGKRYTATLTGGKLAAANFMKFTIDTSKNTDDATDKTFIVPLPPVTVSGYGFTILWGDGNSKVFSDGATLTKADLTHTYAAAGEYQITIRSTETNTANLQIPALNFSGYSDNNNMKKLISMDTPILNTTAIDFINLFMGCTNLTTIPAGLFDNNNQATSFVSCFRDCSNLTTIPDKLFDNNNQATTFGYCFAGCTNLTTIPAGLFDNNNQATTFGYCFRDCSNLTTIPVGLFDKNTLAADFSSCFASCSNLTTIPVGLFDKNTLAADFSSCFANCSNLNTIPTGLFDKNTQAKNFSGCFSSCFSLTTIPNGLFDKNTKATNFQECFMECLILTSIPAGLFDNNTLATTFSYCFSGCGNLTTIPAGLFTNNTDATNFEGCFDACDKLKLNKDIFCNEATEKTTRFLGKSVNFTYCFFRSSFTGNQGTAPALWEYTGVTLDGTTCFGGAGNSTASLTNYDDIPQAWGGPKVP